MYSSGSPAALLQSRSVYTMLVRLEDELGDMAGLSTQQIAAVMAAAGEAALEEPPEEEGGRGVRPGPKRRAGAPVHEFTLRVLREVQRNLQSGRRDIGRGLQDLLTDLEEARVRSGQLLLTPIRDAGSPPGSRLTHAPRRQLFPPGHVLPLPR